MANWADPRGAGARPATGVGRETAAYDAGLRSYMLSVYNYMASGIMLTGIVALLFVRSGLAVQVLTTPLRYLIMLAPLGFVFAISYGVNRMQTGTLKLLFWSFCGVMGLSMASIFLVYTGASIATTFLAPLPGV